MSVSLKASNGIGGMYEYTVTAADQSATYVIFDFNSLISLTAQIELRSSGNAIITNVGAIITYPAVGQVKVANGGSVTLTAGQKLIINIGIPCTAL